PLPPGLKSVHPSFYRVKATPQLVHLKRAAPPVVYPWRHRHFRPIGFTLTTEAHDRRNYVMPVSEDIRFDRNRFADDALDWEPSAIYLGRHSFNNDARSAVLLWGNTQIHSAYL